MTAIDTAQVDRMFTELRLPTVKAVWQPLAERADKEGWPAARLLAALAEQETRWSPATAGSTRAPT